MKKIDGIVKCVFCKWEYDNQGYKKLCDCCEVDKKIVGDVNFKYLWLLTSEFY